MKKLLGLIVLFLICLSLKAQNGNLSQVKLKSASVLLSSKPVDMKFSLDENFLFVAVKLSDNKIQIIKINCNTNTIVGAHAITFQALTFKDFVVSPDQKSIILRNWTANLYYVYNFAQSQEVHFVGNQGNSDYNLFFIDNNSFFYNTDSYEVNGNIFLIDQWGSNVSQDRNVYNNVLSNYWNTVNTLNPANRFYNLAFGSGGISAVENANANNSQLLSPMNDGVQGPHAISIKGKRIAYTNRNGITIKTSSIDESVKDQLYCFDINNYDNIPQQEKIKASHLISKNTLIASVVFARLHPITHQPLGPGEYKATLLIVAQRGTTLYAKLTNKVSPNTQVNEGDYVVGLRQTSNDDDNLGGTNDGTVMGYRWALLSNLKRCESIPPLVDQPKASSSTVQTANSDVANVEKPYGIILQELFTDNRRGWPLGNGAGYQLSINQQQYVMVNGTGSLFQPGLPLNLGGGIEYKITSQLHQMNGQSDIPYGMCFSHQDSANEYMFEISGAGLYRVCRFLDGQFYTILPWTESSAITKGNSRNKLMVWYKGGSILEFYVNDTLVNTIDNFDVPFSGIGFILENNQQLNAESLTIEAQQQ